MDSRPCSRCDDLRRLIGNIGPQGPAGDRGPCGLMGPPGQQGVVSNDYSEYIVKLGPKQLQHFPQSLAYNKVRDNDSVGSYAMKYCTNDTYRINKINVNCTPQTDSPTGVQFSIIVNRKVSKVFLSSAGFGHNYYPIEASSLTPDITMIFEDNSEYLGYVTTGAIFSLVIRWE